MRLSNSEKAIREHYSPTKGETPAPYFDLGAFKLDSGALWIKEGFDREILFLLSHGFRFLAVDFLGFVWVYRSPPSLDSLTETWTSQSPQASVKSINPIKGPHPSKYYDLKKYLRINNYSK